MSSRQHTAAARKLEGQGRCSDLPSPTLDHERRDCLHSALKFKEISRKGSESSRKYSGKKVEGQGKAVERKWKVKERTLTFPPAAASMRATFQQAKADGFANKEIA